MHGKTMREALNEVRSFRDATNEGGPGSGPQKSYKTIPKNETESEKDIRLDKATAVKKAANDKRISDAIKQFQKQDEKQKKKSGELKFRKYDTNEGGPGSGPQKGGKKQTSANIKKAYGILNDPRYKQGNYSGAAKAIDKLSPGLSNHPDVKNAMKRANETLDLPATGDTTTSNASQENETVELESINEFKLKDSDIEKLKKGVKQGKPIKVFKLNKPVKAGYGEDLDEAKFTPAQISALKKAYGNIAPMRVSVKNTNKMRDLMKTYSKDLLKQLAVLDIPMVSNMAKELT